MLQIFLMKFTKGNRLASEIRGSDNPRNKAKRDALAELVEAVNQIGGGGRWSCDVAFQQSEIQDILERHS